MISGSDPGIRYNTLATMHVFRHSNYMETGVLLGGNHSIVVSVLASINS